MRETLAYLSQFCIKKLYFYLKLEWKLRFKKSRDEKYVSKNAVSIKYLLILDYENFANNNNNSEDEDEEAGGWNENYEETEDEMKTLKGKIVLLILKIIEESPSKSLK